MATREALLALLERGPANAYQLKKDFDRTVGLTWPLNMGQVSTTLQRLQRDGLIEQTVTTGAPDAAATESNDIPLWRITDAGRTSLERWWRTPVLPEQRGRDELVMKIAIAVEVPGIDLMALVQRQRASLQQLLHDMTRARRRTPSNELAVRLVIDHHIFTTEAELRWLDTVDEAHLRSRLPQHERRQVGSKASSFADTPLPAANMP